MLDDSVKVVLFSCFMFIFFFFNDTATTEIYTLSLHDALPICHVLANLAQPAQRDDPHRLAHAHAAAVGSRPARSEEHTSELQSRQYLVCRLLLEKKKKKNKHSRRSQNKKPTNNK